jgi:hypothetical protein
VRLQTCSDISGLGFVVTDESDSGKLDICIYTATGGESITYMLDDADEASLLKMLQQRQANREDAECRADPNFEWRSRAIAKVLAVNGLDRPTRIIKRDAGLNYTLPEFGLVVAFQHTKGWGCSPALMLVLPEVDWEAGDGSRGEAQRIQDPTFSPQINRWIRCQERVPS